MTPEPTGQLLSTPSGHDLVLTRTYAAPASDVWASVTEPERTARWFGPWRGEAAPGRTVEVRMTFEESAPWSPMRIDACEPPHRLAVSTQDEAGSWSLELLLTESEGVTELRLVHHLVPRTLSARSAPAGSTTWTCSPRHARAAPCPSSRTTTRPRRRTTSPRPETSKAPRHPAAAR
ncbi:SRPBCC domain-containing protein [Streptomyces scabiei]|uniref:SRPBCC domain-containing protein n=1 Tax=Streptomyces scabiei TaxID=1930 RepID=UPI001FF5E3DC|nr:SRPBCC domain-containing protein [Streptomyces sp. LBUM 1481]